MRQLLLIVFALLLLSDLLPAQPPTEVLPYRMFVRLEGNVPHGLSNKAFRRSFTGVYDAQLATGVEVFAGFSIGAAFRNSLWKTPDNKIPGLNTQMHCNSIGLRLGYDKRISRTAVAYASLTVGQTFARFTGLAFDQGTSQADLNSVVDQYRYNAIEPQIGAYFYTEGNFAIGLQAGVVFTNFNFDPYKLLLDQQKAYIESDLDGNLAQFNIGIHIQFGFLKKQGAQEPISD